ncbi:Uncharacterised protein [BD1-7 clade bacterium]|uniref:TraB/GumN family protein n=1 Tax=BD1-7 clade bacterium TaxID=2029982 RepID=A0A5S9QQC2_9GAMM|nr:Uncharacterised protein [BD1-7 clade bacterium]CAA0121794.1 Uncharacterised protein [BD1-7 clade bacterium]
MPALFKAPASLIVCLYHQFLCASCVRYRRLFGAVLLLVFANISLAQSPVWRISDAEKSFYLGGTIHVLRASDYPLPEAFDEAYSKTNTVVLEVDIDSISQARFESLVLSSVFYPPNENLKQHLNKSAFKALSAYCRSVDIPVESLLKMRPGLVISTISVTELQKLGADQDGVDTWFATKARRDGKAVEGLETVEQQIEFLANLGTGNESRIILQTLQELEQLSDELNALTSAWRKGDLALLDQLVVKPMKDDYPRVYEQLLLTRNQQWLPLLERFLASDHVEFVLVGAAHLAGDEGLVEQLRKRGYQVEQLP